MAASGIEDRTRVGWVDVAKGICIVFVVMMHSTLGIEKAVGEAGWMGAVVAFAMPFRMPDFFLISGLFLSAVITRPWRVFLDRRVLHFAYFYLLWLCIQFALRAPGMVAEIGAGETLRLFLLSIVAEPYGTLWFIWMLPVFALVVRLTRRVPVPVMLILAAALEMLPIATGWTAVDEFAARFVYLYIGYAFAPLVFAFAARVAGHAAAALAGFLVWAVVNGALVWMGWAALPGVSLALGLAGAAAVVCAAALLRAVPLAGPALAALGSRSLVVYLAFFLPMIAMRTFLLKTGILPDVGAMALATTIVSVLVPLAMQALAKRAGARFLFARPAWATMSPEPSQPSMKASTASA